MLATTLGAVGVYYLWSMVLGLNDTAGMALGISAGIVLSVLFARMKEKKK